MRVTFKNPKTGELKEVKVGFSWVLFLFSPFLGFPLFLRRLNIWGGVFLLLWFVNIIAQYMISDPVAASLLVLILFIIIFALSIWVGIKGNEMTAKNYLETGWVFADEKSDAVRFAKGKWGILV